MPLVAMPLNLPLNLPECSVGSARWLVQGVDGIQGRVGWRAGRGARVPTRP